MISVSPCLEDVILNDSQRAEQALIFSRLSYGSEFDSALPSQSDIDDYIGSMNGSYGGPPTHGLDA